MPVVKAARSEEAWLGDGLQSSAQDRGGCWQEALVSTPLGGPGHEFRAILSALCDLSPQYIFWGEKASSFTNCVTDSVRCPTSWGAKVDMVLLIFSIATAPFPLLGIPQ